MRAPLAWLLFTACVGGSTPSGTAVPTDSAPETATTADPAYVAAVNLWHADRVAALKAPDGWLSLAGLFWLEEDGLHEVGSDADDPIRLPRASVDTGILRKAGANVTFTPSASALVTLNGQPVVGSVDLRADSHEKGPTKLEHNGVTFYLVQRADRYGIRVKDPKAEARTNFAGIPRYPVDPSLKVMAKLTPHDSEVTLTLPSVIGTTSEEPSPGLLSFTLNGQEHWLHPVMSGNGLFIVFGDQTNGPESYGGGRFLTAKAADADGNVELDFNKAINPPCAFTPYATCPLPPTENKLAVRIPAGERNVEGAHPHE
ncbi:MAG: DUF1684 domain-containing protein [Myxococcota bacterium]